jgi:flavorubredoxin
MTQINEIAPDMYRISTFIPEINLQFNQFLVRDEQPLLYHTGMKGLFPIVRDAVATLIDPATIRLDRLQSFRGR